MRKSMTTPIAVAMPRAKLGARMAITILMALGLTATVAAVSAETRGGTFSFDIPAQKLNDALQAVAFTSQHKLLYSSKLVDGRESPALKGKYTTSEAVAKLLAGTGLVYQVTPDGLVVIREAAPVKTSADVPRAQGLQLAQSELPAEVKIGSSSGNRESSVADKQSSDDKIQEIVVTAQKREERLQDVPMSIGVVTADEIDQRGFASADDYLRGMPSVNHVDQGGVGGVIVIRGLETTLGNQNLGQPATVATYFGETPTTSSGGLTANANIDLKLVDIERVEVLRGPQGTAFGNSSMGGAVRTIPVAPKLDRFEGRAAAGFSSTAREGGENFNFQATGNLPLIVDRLAIRATAYRYEDSGFYRNVAASDPAVRDQILIPYGGDALAVDEKEVGSVDVTGGRLAALMKVTDNLRLTLNYLKQKSEQNGLSSADLGNYTQARLQVAPEHRVRGRTGAVIDTDIEIANAVIEYGLGWGNLVATYSHTDGGTIRSLPFGGGFNFPGSTFGPGDHREGVGEVRIATTLDGRWNFLAGAYYEHVKDKGLFDYYWSGDPLRNIFDPNGITDPERRHIGYYLDRRDLKQKAIFGEASWELLDGLTLTGGVRHYDYDNNTQLNAEWAFPPVNSTPIEIDAKGENYRANLSYRINADALIYAGWAQGFRLGRPQQALFTCDLDGNGVVDGTDIPLSSTGQVKADNVDSYEIGGKLSLLDRRLAVDIAAFRMNWSDMPVSATAGSVTTGCGITYVTNAGKAKSDGVEFQAKFRINELVRVDFGGSWIHARITKDDIIGGLPTSAGARLPGSPKVNANLGIQYGFGIGSYRAYLRADSIYVGHYFGDLQESLGSEAGGYLKLDVAARMEVGDLDIDLFVRNLTNEDAFTLRQNALIGNLIRPRTIGFQLAYSFK